MSPARRTVVALAAALCGLAPAVAAAQSAPAADTPTGVTVVGTGLVERLPDTAEITAVVMSEAKLANDAVVKFRDARKQALAALNGLGIEGMTVTPQGHSVGFHDPNNQQMIFNGIQPAQAQNSDERPVRVVEPLVIKVAEIDASDPQAVLETMMQLIDACREAGLRVGPIQNPHVYQPYQDFRQAAIVTFKLSDLAAAEREAEKAAVADARAKADRLAALTGVELAGVSGIGVSPRTPQPVYTLWMVNPQGEQTPAAKALEPVRVETSLIVRYDIRPAAAAPTAAGKVAAAEPADEPVNGAEPKE